MRQVISTLKELREVAALLVAASAVIAILLPYPWSLPFWLLPALAFLAVLVAGAAVVVGMVISVLRGALGGF